MPSRRKGGTHTGRLPSPLAALLRSLDRLDGVRWIRLMYAYPRRFDSDLIDAMAACERVVKYVDIPLQHVCDPVLKRMRRSVSRAQIEALLSELRQRIPGVAIRTTFIVGFPGETERMFGQLMDFVRDFRFEAAGVFEFSPEEGTPAARLGGRVPAKEKALRAKEFMLLQRRIALAANRRRIGQRVEVLVDGADAKGRSFGRHAGQAPEIDSVCLLSAPRPAGRLLRCTVTGYAGYDLIVKPD